MPERDRILEGLAAFCHAHPLGSRFAGADRGAWYAGFEIETSHAEVAFLDGYGPGQDDPDLRWDLLALSGLPVTKNLRPGGYLLREKALEYSKLFEHSKVLELPQPQELELLAA